MWRSGQLLEVNDSYRADEGHVRDLKVIWVYDSHMGDMLFIWEPLQSHGIYDNHVEYIAIMGAYDGQRGYMTIKWEGGDVTQGSCRETVTWLT